MSADLVIRNGKIFDPGQKIEFTGDIEISNGIVVNLAKSIPAKGKMEFDAQGCYISPGWIDIHAHVYEHATELGVNADEYCVKRGVTTVVDAGSSGHMTFKGLRHFIMEQSETRVLAFLHIACHGLACAGCAGDAPGESDSLSVIQKDKCVECIRSNRDKIVGVKVRLDKTVTNNGANEHEVYLRAIEASRAANVPLMVHHTNSTIPLSGVNSFLACPGSLKQGDIYTHAFHGHKSTILDRPKGKIFTSVVRAQKSGVLMDVGHGQGSFDWSVAEAAIRSKHYPDTISSDLHSGNSQGPVKDLAHVMSKMLFIGMPLDKVICSVTNNAATAIGKQHELGALMIGREADLTLFKVEPPINDKEAIAVDAFNKEKKMKKIFRVKATFKRGRMFQTGEKFGMHRETRV